MKLRLFNSLTHRKEDFIPLDPNKVRMYVCGPTVYDYPHLGNALAVVIYDVLYRLLINFYGKEKICYVRNITDVDDKIIIAAHQQNIGIHQLTEEITKIFKTNISELNCLEPNFEPKATDHIPEMITMIEKLLEKKFAYEANNHIYFDVSKFAKYYDLSGRKKEENLDGVRVEISATKQSQQDFVLWKPAKDLDHSFASPFGTGRPGWHIECSAMSSKFLGNDFDIHGGGIDLIFPHHTNEIAQSCCANPGSNFAKYWVHNGFLTVNGEKMSKSLGNFITINELLKRGIPGEVIRYILLSSHYRKPLDWNEKAIDDANKSLNLFYNLIAKIEPDQKTEIPQEFIDCLCDDLNTPKAFALLHNYAKNFQRTADLVFINKLFKAGNLIGFFAKTPTEWFNKITLTEDFIFEQIEIRSKAKHEKNWILADQIRAKLLAENIILQDNKDGPTTWTRSN